jgi:acyl-CoA thioesterase I
MALMLALSCSTVEPALHAPPQQPTAPEPSSLPPASPAPTAQRDEYLSALCAELRSSWPGNRTINIVCHGHSVPAGYFATPVVESFNAYPHLLHRALKERFPHAVINVIVTSIGGENSVSGAARFETDVLNHKPDLITIDYALNDRGIGIPAAREALESMLVRAERAAVPVIMLSPTWDLNAKLDDPADRLNLQAELVRELALEHGVGLVDSLAAFHAEIDRGMPAEELMSIPNHPNRRGHELVVRELLEWFPAKSDRAH